MAGTQVVTILFCDLVASTERRARLGDDRFDEFSERFLRRLRDAIDEHHGREVSNAGDGLMVVFPVSVADAVACATPDARATSPRSTPRTRPGCASGSAPARSPRTARTSRACRSWRRPGSSRPPRPARRSPTRSCGRSWAHGARCASATSATLTLKGIPRPLPTVEVVGTDVADDAPSAPRHRAAAPSGRTPRRPVRSPVAIVVVVALVAAAFAATRTDDDSTHADAAGVPTPHGYTPRYVPSPKCPSEIVAVAANATCGELVVPQNRAEPNGQAGRAARVAGAGAHPVARGTEHRRVRVRGPRQLAHARPRRPHPRRAARATSTATRC